MEGEMDGDVDEKEMGDGKMMQEADKRRTMDERGYPSRRCHFNPF